ncbi:MAG: ribosomal protein S18-alanine N-acetyltransferase [Deltaproteobacteria bacterium]|jgi:ribosomal-protein-alanine N-acetyltransferase|nr:ribosomal protein S18-alanine N-acetyltransferase [Deltaproteobacteria bacterium]
MRVPDPAALEFFRLSRNELDALAELEQLCFTMPWSKEQLAGHFGLPNFAAYGLRTPSGKNSEAEDAARLAAYVSFYHSQDELEILNLAVAPEWRRLGCGARLLRPVLRMAAEAGIGRAVLEVRSGNAPALALYAGQGFTKIGSRRGYYHDSGEDALILELVLSK